MSDVYTSYVRQVGRRLRCSKAEKKRLLAGLETELADTFPEPESLSSVELSARFGTPKDIAAELQTILPAENKMRYATQRERVKRAALIGSVLLLLTMSVWGLVRWRRDQEIINGDFRIVVHDPQEITDEEFVARFEEATR